MVNDPSASDVGAVSSMSVAVGRIALSEKTSADGKKGGTENISSSVVSGPSTSVAVAKDPSSEKDSLGGKKGRTEKTSSGSGVAEGTSITVAFGTVALLGRTALDGKNGRMVKTSSGSSVVNGSSITVAVGRVKSSERLSASVRGNGRIEKTSVSAADAVAVAETSTSVGAMKVTLSEMFSPGSIQGRIENRSSAEVVGGASTTVVLETVTFILSEMFSPGSIQGRTEKRSSAEVVGLMVTVTLLVVVVVNVTFTLSEMFSPGSSHGRMEKRSSDVVRIGGSLMVTGTDDLTGPRVGRGIEALVEVDTSGTTRPADCEKDIGPSTGLGSGGENVSGGGSKMVNSIAISEGTEVELDDSDEGKKGRTVKTSPSDEADITTEALTEADATPDTDDFLELELGIP